MTGRPATAGQLTALGAALRAAGYRNRDARLDWIEDQLGRPVDSSAELTHGEAARLLDTAHDAAPRPPGKRLR
jgi:hypothetical protein